jgi:hypothetical protein
MSDVLDADSALPSDEDLPTLDPVLQNHCWTFGGLASGFKIHRRRMGIWAHLASRSQAATANRTEGWTTRFTLNSPESWLIAISIFSIPFHSLHYGMLAVAQKPMNDG